MDEVPRASVISDIQSSSVGDERSRVCVSNSMTYGSETRTLVVDVVLKFERAETTVIRTDRLKWYGHVMRKGEEDWVKKCMEYRVEGRRPRRAWLEIVKADMAELEIDKEHIHDGKK